MVDATVKTAVLLEQVLAGDEVALDRLLQRHLPLLQRWATRRLPQWARNGIDTADLVQETAVQALKHLKTFEYRGDGSLQAYLRQCFMNKLRDQLRRKAIGHHQSLPSILTTDAASPYDALLASRLVASYERALDQMSREDRELIVARMELELSYAEIAERTHKPSHDAARMAVSRAVLRLAELMKTFGYPATDV